MKQITWNLKQFFESDDDPRIGEKRKIIEQKSYEFINEWKDGKDYLKNPVVLKQALDEYERWKRDYGTDGDEGYYFWLRTTQDQNNPKLSKIQSDRKFQQTD
jgi:oligoendopeptidase F